MPREQRRRQQETAEHASRFLPRDCSTSDLKLRRPHSARLEGWLRAHAVPAFAGRTSSARQHDVYSTKLSSSSTGSPYLLASFTTCGSRSAIRKPLSIMRGVADLHGHVEHDAILVRVRLLPARHLPVHELARPVGIGAEVQRAGRVGAGRIGLEARIFRIEAAAELVQRRVHADEHVAHDLGVHRVAVHLHHDAVLVFDADLVAERLLEADRPLRIDDAAHVGLARSGRGAKQVRP